MPRKYDNAIVTGACGGLGHALASELIAGGARVALVGLQVPVLERLASAVRPRRRAPAATAFDRAVEEVAASARTLIQSLVTRAEPRTREAEAAKALERSAARFGAKA